MTKDCFDDRICALGEGPLWHPERQQLFWFDILGNRLLTRDDSGPREWHFDEHVSAAGWVDRDTLLMASETGLYTFDIPSGERQLVAFIEADNSVTRSNDGRADPQGGFWIGTMGKAAEPEAGAIYRYYRGELRQLFDNISISNSICFAPDGNAAYFTDTPTKQIMRVALDPKTGWPRGEVSVHLDLSKDGLNPDGSVVDAAGNLWNAQWGSNRVACYAPGGQFLRAVDFAGAQISCPAFGGPDFATLFATSAAVGLTGADEGKTFVTVLDGVKGQAEHRVIL